MGKWPDVVRSLLCMNTRDFLPHLATFVCSSNLLVDCECGKKEREDFIALIEVTGCAFVLKCVLITSHKWF